MTSVSHFDDVLARIRAFAVAKGWKPSRLAREAGIADVVTRGIDRPDWSPSGKSVRALERVIPVGWNAGDPLPTPSEEAAA